MDKNIAQLGNPILRSSANTVDFPLSKDVEKVIKNMKKQVADANGVGIAATQIFVSLRIFIMCSKPSKRYPNAPQMEPAVIINPVIISTEGEKKKDWEGCLSVPNIRGLVPRHPTIEVEYFDEQGKCIKRQLTNFLARIFQHEIDHLEGKTFLDHIESTTDLMSEIEWRRQIVAEQ